MLEVIADSPFSPQAARDIAVREAFFVATGGRLTLDWAKEAEVRTVEHSELEGRVYRSHMRVPIIEDV